MFFESAIRGYAHECKKICGSQTNRRRRGIFYYGWAVSWAGFINRDGPDLIELVSDSSSALCWKYVIDLMDIRPVTISSGSTPFKST